MFTPCPLWHAHNTQLPMVHSACTHFVSKTIIACALHENAQHSLFKVQKTLEGFLEHFSGEFIEKSYIVEIETLLSILTFHVSLHYWPLRHGICPKFYTAGFSGYKFYIVNFTKF